MKITFQFTAENPSSKRCLPLSVIAVEAFPIRYMLQTQAGFGKKFSISERLLYKPGICICIYFHPFVLHGNNWTRHFVQH
jgi:hypothetical protein